MIWKRFPSVPARDQVTLSPSGSVAVYVATDALFSGTDFVTGPVITGGSFTSVTVTRTVTATDTGRAFPSLTVTVTR